MVGLRNGLYTRGTYALFITFQPYLIASESCILHNYNKQLGLAEKLN